MFYTLKEVAIYFRLSRSAIRENLYKGNLLSQRIQGTKKHIFSKESLENFVKKFNDGVLPFPLEITRQ